MYFNREKTDQQLNEGVDNGADLGEGLFDFIEKIFASDFSYESISSLKEEWYDRKFGYVNADKWDIRFIELAKHIRTWSKDPSTKVGAVIVDPFHRIISLGFNGFAKGVGDQCLDNRELKYAKILHAEINSILFAPRNISGCTLYCTEMPCSQCAAAIIQSQISRVVTLKPRPEMVERWGEQFEIAQNMFKEAYVQFNCLEYEG